MAKTAAFEQFSDAYDDWFERNPEAYQAELKAVRELLPPGPAQGMEVGVGSGKFAIPCGIEIGVEPCVQMAEKARELGIRVVPGVAEVLPFPEAEFDFVLMVTTICFVDDIVQSFREALRVLKPGGCLLSGYVDRESELGRRYQENRESSRFYREATFFSTEEVLEALHRAGFAETETRQTLIPDADSMLVKPGYGEGAFVVIRAVKSP